VETKKSNLFGFMAGEFKVIGDTEPPVVPLKHWEILQKWSCSTRTF